VDDPGPGRLHAFAHQAGELGIPHDLAEQSAQQIAGRSGHRGREVAQHGEDVGAQGAGVGHVDGAQAAGRASVDDEVGATGPAPVQGGLPGAGSRGHAFHGQCGVADLGEFLQGGGEDGLFQCLAAPAGVSSVVAGSLRRSLRVG
jgi:hypothetical protein